MSTAKLKPKQQRRLYLASGSVHEELAQQTADYLGANLEPVKRRRFPNGDRYIQLESSVRRKRAFLMQTMCGTSDMSVNDALAELLLMVDAAKRSSADEINVIMPKMAYDRQDKMVRRREAIGASMAVRALQGAGAHRLITIDMHSGQTQAIFDGPFDHLTARGLILDTFRPLVDANPDGFVVASPDSGRAKVSEKFAEKLGIPLRHVPKSRDKEDSSRITRPEHVPGVEGFACLVIDDMIDTGGTIETAAHSIYKSGATDIYVATTHGVLSDPALKRLADSPITQFAIGNTVPLDDARAILGDRLLELDCSPILGQAVLEIMAGGSISDMFDGDNYD